MEELSSFELNKSCESKNVLKSSIGSFPISQESIVKIYITPELKKGARCWIVFKISYYESKKNLISLFAATDKWISPPTKEEIVKVFADHDTACLRAEVLQHVRRGAAGAMQVVGPPLKAE